MTFTKAIEILKAHQSWRLGKIEEMPYKPLEITEALDVLLLVVDDKLEASMEERFQKFKPKTLGFTRPTEQEFTNVGMKPTP